MRFSTEEWSLGLLTGHIICRPNTVPGRGRGGETTGAVRASEGLPGEASAHSHEHLGRDVGQERLRRS